MTTGPVAKSVGNNYEPFAPTTATARTTPSRKYVSILLWNFTFIWNYLVCLLVLNLAPAEYATNVFNFK